MIVKEFIQGGKLIRQYSDEGYTLLQVETGIEYGMAVDVYPCQYTYEETTNLIDEPGKTPADIKEELTSAVQKYMDNKARERGYDDILKAVSYRGDAVNETFAKEAEACFVWRSAVWTKCYAILAEIEADLRGIPTVEELIAELPKLVWPDEVAE